jgi:hypothetical protein
VGFAELVFSLLAFYDCLFAVGDFFSVWLQGFSDFWVWHGLVATSIDFMSK